MATGAMSTAVAVLEIKSPITAVVINNIAKIIRGPALPNSPNKPSTAKAIPPVFAALGQRVACQQSAKYLASEWSDKRFPYQYSEKHPLIGSQ